MAGEKVAIGAADIVSSIEVDLGRAPESIAHRVALRLREMVASGVDYSRDTVTVVIEPHPVTVADDPLKGAVTIRIRSVIPKPE